MIYEVKLQRRECKMRKVMSIIISIIIIMLSLCSISVTAEKAGLSADEEIAGDFVYEKGTNKIIAYAGKSGVCELPENAEVSGLYRPDVSSPITELIVNKNVGFNMSGSNKKAFFSLKKVVFKEGITEIPYNAFKECNTLEEAEFASTITKIGDYAFSDCPKLKSIELPKSLTSIGDYAFFGDTSLSGDIIMPDTVTYMGKQAFSECGQLGRVHLSDNISEKPSDGNDWFSRTAIREINIPDSLLDNPPSLHADEITFNSDMTVKIFKAVRDSDWCNNKYLKGKTDKDTGDFKDFVIAENTVLKYTGSSKNPVVPEGIKSITEYAFSYCNIDTVTLSHSLESIDASAFAYATLKEVTIPQKVKTVSDGAFRNCPLIEKVTFEGAPTVGRAFPESGFLTRENIVIKNPSIKLDKDFYEFEGVENNLDSYYNMLKEHETTVDNKVIPSSSPTPTATSAPDASPAPTGTPKPTDAPQTLTVQNGDALTIEVNGKTVNFPDAQPFVDENGRTQVPVRAVSELLDCKVDWLQDIKTAVITKSNGDIVKITLYSDIMTVNDRQIKMDTSAVLKDDRTFIPVRFTAEALGLTVNWSE